jgi:chloride channel protein, CIC family
VSIAQPKQIHPARRAVMHLRTVARLLARRYVRDSDLGVVLIAAAIGVVIALGVALTKQAVDEFHHFLFGLPIETYLSSAESIALWRTVLVPSLGGLAYGVVAYVMWRRWPCDIVDAIEANALQGGRMSLFDSLRLTILTIMSGGVGASVGLEAAFTQLGSGIASRVGRLVQLRRNDLRTFVGCGAAAAIAAAFNAPLAGAFYAFELIIGNYTLATLIPVVGAAVTAILVTRQLFDATPIFVVFSNTEITAQHYLILTTMGIAAGLLAIGAMLGVTYVERFVRRFALPTWLRPALGGLVLGAIAVAFPQVLGSGHGGIQHVIAVGSAGFELPLLICLILAKVAASAVSIGSGFRGGMFSSSLFLGSLYGAACGLIVHRLLPSAPPDDAIFVLAGMGAVAAGVVGAPMTMIFLVLEATTDFQATMGVTVSVLISALAVRHLFGYSFATWRFHLRGVMLHSPYDVGWLQELQVARLMRRDFVVVPAVMPLSELCRVFPITESRQIFVADEHGGYSGHADIVEAHAAAAKSSGESSFEAADVAHAAAHFLTPWQPVRQAIDLFAGSATEVLAVVDNARDRHVIGYLTEAYALRRYYRELEAHHREELGDESLFMTTRAPAD